MWLLGCFHAPALLTSSSVGTLLTDKEIMRSFQTSTHFLKTYYVFNALLGYGYGGINQVSAFKVLQPIGVMGRPC